MIMKTFHPQSSTKRGFSLTELIAVMGIMGLLIAVSVPALSSLARAKGATSAAHQIKDYLDLARNYAMSNQTLVRVGIEEVPASRMPSGKPALVFHAIKNFNPSEVGTVESLQATSSVAVNVKDSSGNYEYWDDLSRPLVLEGVGIKNLNKTALGTELSTNNTSLEDFTRPINGVLGSSGNVVFDRGFVISRQGEFCLEGDLTLDISGDGSIVVDQHQSYPSRPFYFGLIEVVDGGGTPTEVGENEVAIALNGLSGRVQIYRKGDTLPGGSTKL